MIEKYTAKTKAGPIEIIATIKRIIVRPNAPLDLVTAYHIFFVPRVHREKPDLAKILQTKQMSPAKTNLQMQTN